MDKQYLISEKELDLLSKASVPMRGANVLTVKDFLKSKKPVQLLDRDNILAELKDFMNETGLISNVEQDQLEDLADTFSYLIPQQTIGTEDEIKKILAKKFVLKDYWDEDVDKAIKELSSLAKPEQDDGEVIASNKVRFPKNNKISYGQDMGFHRGIPSDVDFEIEEFTDDRARLIADGYGGQAGTDKYGNGAIYVSKKDIKITKGE